MLTFTLQNDTLSLLRNGKTIYTLAAGDTFVRVGCGENRFSMARGSFTIKDSVTKDIPLTVRSIRLDGDTGFLTLSEGEAALALTGDRLHVLFKGLDAFNRMWITLPAGPHEHVYGTGETFSEFDLRGQKVNVWVAEHQNAKMLAKKVVKIKFGLDIADKKQKFSNYETYYAQPTFLSSRKYYFHSQTTARCVFDFTKPNVHTLRTDAIADFMIGFGDTFGDVLTELTDVLGRPPALPDWAPCPLAASGATRRR